MRKNILALVTMLMIFPIANADGKILNGTDEDPFSNRITDSYLLEEVSNNLDNDTIKEKNDSLSEDDEIKIKEVVEKAADISSGVVSWYGGKFHGRKTASGDRYDKNELTAAHKTLPFGTKVKVTNTRNGKSVIVEINDRGPFVKSRVLDLSQAAFSEIGHTNTGVMHVEYKILDSQEEELD